MPQIILTLNNTDEIIIDDKISCYLISDGFSAEKIKAVVATEKMILVEGEKALDVCKKYNLDGVVKEIDVTKPVKIQLKKLREELKRKTLGVIIPARRHEAMLAGEVEPEFIAFRSNNTDKDADVIAWYNELFLIPLAWVYETEGDVNKINGIDFAIVDSKKLKILVDKK
jgi:hypothetical protein